MATAILALETGLIFQGEALGAERQVEGELVFNTGMTGYQEILTDPSYAGQIITLTYPLIGNYGVTSQDSESSQVFALGLVVRELSRTPSNWRSEEDLQQFLQEQGVPGIAGVDTRVLVRHLREYGTCRAALSTRPDANADALLARARQARALGETDWVAQVSCREPRVFIPEDGVAGGGKGMNSSMLHVVLVDFGAKTNQVRLLLARGCRVTVVPAASSAEVILDLHPDGVLLSNGPGDPEVLSYAINTVRTLLTKAPHLPLFGICLGHQVLALALGAHTYKLKFGHRGANHPVMELATGRSYMTSQNHGYAVDEKSLPPGVRVSHRELNDGTVEGLEVQGRPVFSIQFHPEAAPGPREAEYFLDRFVDLIRQAREHAHVGSCARG